MNTCGVLLIHSAPEFSFLLEAPALIVHQDSLRLPLDSISVAPLLSLCLPVPSLPANHSESRGLGLFVTSLTRGTVQTFQWYWAAAMCKLWLNFCRADKSRCPMTVYSLLWIPDTPLSSPRNDVLCHPKSRFLFPHQFMPVVFVIVMAEL